MCIGEIIFYIIIVIQIIIYLLFAISLNNVLGSIKLMCISVPYGLFLYIWSKMWKNIIGEMCMKDLDYQSVMVLLSPLIYIILCIICYFTGILLDRIFNLGAGNKIKDMKLTGEFKNYIDNSVFNLIEYDDKKKNILEKYDEKTKEKILHDEIFLDKGWTIKNLINNPYSFEIIGNNRNSEKRGLIILENKTINGWDGYLKIVNFNKEVDNNINNYSNMELINEENGYKIEFKTLDNYDDVMIIEGAGSDRGVYSCNKNISFGRLVLNVIIIVVIIYICYLTIINY